MKLLKAFTILAIFSSVNSLTVPASHFQHSREDMIIYELEGLDVDSTSYVNLVDGTWYDHDSDKHGAIININDTYTGYVEGNGYIVSTVGSQPIGTFFVNSNDDQETSLAKRYTICCSFTACGKQIEIYVS